MNEYSILVYTCKFKHSEECLKKYITYNAGMLLSRHPEYSNIKPDAVIKECSSYHDLEKTFQVTIKTLKDSNITYILLIPSLDDIANSSHIAFRLLRKTASRNIIIYVNSLSLTYDIKNLPKSIVNFYASKPDYETGLRGRKPLYSEKLIDSAVKDKLNGMTYKEIKEKYGMCKNTLRKYM